MKKLFHTIIYMLLVNSIYGQHKVKFVISEETAIKHDSIYISGTFNDWDSQFNERYKTKHDTDGSHSITLTLNEGTHRYKYNRGNWLKVEKAFNGFEIDDRVIVVRNDTIIYDKVFAWRDEIASDKWVSISKAKSDSARVSLFFNLSIIYSNYPEWYNIDSAFHYISNTLLLLQKIGSSTGLSIMQERENTRYLIYSQGLAANLFNQFGNYSRELELRLSNLKLAEKLNETNPILDAYYGIATTYASVQEYKKSIEYSKKMDTYLQHVKRDTLLFQNFQCWRIIALTYLRLNQPDSTLVYANKLSTPFNTQWSANFAKAVANQIRGDAYALQGNNTLAAREYKAALQIAYDVYAHESGIRAHYGLARIFYAQGRIDSALYHGIQGLEGISTFRTDLTAYQVNPNSLLVEMSPFIAELYRANHQPERAYQQLLLSASLKDSLYNLDKIKQFQNLEFNESLREQQIQLAQQQYRSTIRMYAFIIGLGVLSVIAILLFRNNQQKQKAKTRVEKAYTELKATQSQLIQSEKMASLGELTAGIAHEIQNPLNFVNNFSEVNTELIDELKKELAVGNTQSAEDIVNDIKSNSEKINHHGKRAGDIVKGMLQHSRSSSGVKEATDINALTDEYLRLAYHGLRAKDKSFNATMKTEFDESIGSINIIPQDMGRVILNLITNAFYAVSEMSKVDSQKSGISYEPTVIVSTKKLGDKITINVKDNGNGIPEHIKEKIFQPFFTTKPTGQGTGLGLSLSYDIVKAHGGELRVETKHVEGVPAGASAQTGSEFIIQLPIV